MANNKNHRQSKSPSWHYLDTLIFANISNSLQTMNTIRNTGFAASYLEANDLSRRKTHDATNIN
jgi:hypothetical protein